MEIKRRIRDNLYGTIDISTLEAELIAHPAFQRLRRIRQTSFLSLIFPGASHSRLEHSLGVMHLVGLAWGKIKDNQIRLRQQCSRYKSFATREQNPETGETTNGLLFPTFSEVESIFASSYVLQALRLAALLHDVGHPPFSHSGERFLPDAKSVLRENTHLPEYLRKHISQLGTKSKSTLVSHEILSVILIHEILGEVYFRNPKLAFQVSAQDIASLIIPSINPDPHSELIKHSALHLCRELISGDIDVDRMDYLRRDAKECGVAYGHFDVDRVLDSLTFYFSPDDKQFHLALQYSGLPALEDYLRARQSMYIQLYFHKTAAACEAMLQRMRSLLGTWTLPANIKEYIQMDEHEIRADLTRAGKQSLDKQQQEELQTLIQDLLVNRRLWKMVYEITDYGKNEKETETQLNAIASFLQREHISFEKISSKTALTKLNLKGDGKKSPNTLRLIKLNPKLFPRVERVEDYSSIPRENQVAFHRIYVKPEDAMETRAAIQEVLDS